MKNMRELFGELVGHAVVGLLMIVFVILLVLLGPFALLGWWGIWAGNRLVKEEEELKVLGK